MEEVSEYVYVYKKNRKLGVIDKNIIMYVNCHGRQICIGTPFVTIEHNGTLCGTKRLLGEKNFVQINKSDLVNLKYVIYTDLVSVRMRDGTLFPVTPAFSANFCDKIIELYNVHDQFHANI